jgi:hypothetical protein
MERGGAAAVNAAIFARCFFTLGKRRSPSNIQNILKANEDEKRVPVF